MLVLLNGGFLLLSSFCEHALVALVDACVTEWRVHVRLDFVRRSGMLHSLMLVLLNGGFH